MIRRNVFGAIAAALACLVFGQDAHANIDFGLVPLGGTPSYTGATLQGSSAFNVDGSSLTVSFVGGGDQSGLAVGNTVTISPANLNYGSGGPGALGANVTKSWTDATGTFTETLTSTVLINRSATNAITVVFAGTLLGPGFTNTPVFMELNANQVGGPGQAIAWSATETSTNPVVPEPSTMAIAGLGALGMIGYGLRRRKAMGA